MHFRPAPNAGPIDDPTAQIGRPLIRAIDVYDGDNMAARIYARPDGLEIICQPGWQRASVDIHRDKPLTLTVHLEPTVNRPPETLTTPEPASRFTTRQRTP